MNHVRSSEKDFLMTTRCRQLGKHMDKSPNSMVLPRIQIWKRQNDRHLLSIARFRSAENIPSRVGKKWLVEVNLFELFKTIKSIKHVLYVFPKSNLLFRIKSNSSWGKIPFKYLSFAKFFSRREFFILNSNEKYSKISSMNNLWILAIVYQNHNQ